MISYLRIVKEDSQKTILPDDLHIEYNKARWELHREQYRAQNESNLEMFRSVIASGQNALRAGFLINGGAVIAILAFIGNCYGKPKAFPYAGLVEALLFFALGVLAIGLASAGTYITQQLYYTTIHQGDRKAGDRVNIIVFSLGITSAILFVVGTLYAYLTLKNIIL